MELTRHKRARLLTRLREDSGHTMVEILVALAVLAIAVVPAAQLVTRIMLSGASRDLMIATRLAQAEIEAALLEPQSNAAAREVVLSGKRWQVRRIIATEEGLVRISAHVFKKNVRTPMVSLTTLRLAE